LQSDILYIKKNISIFLIYKNNQKNTLYYKKAFVAFCSVWSLCDLYLLVLFLLFLLFIYHILCQSLLSTLLFETEEDVFKVFFEELNFFFGHLDAISKAQEDANGYMNSGHCFTVPKDSFQGVLKELIGVINGIFFVCTGTIVGNNCIHGLKEGARTLNCTDRVLKEFNCTNAGLEGGHG